MSTSTWIRKGLDIAKMPRVKLNNIQDLPGAKRRSLRIGRGPGCRRGKTCGRGHKGQEQRNKHAIRVGFEGGQTPFYLTVPKHGFKNKFQIRYEPLNLSRLQYMLDTGRLDGSKPIKMDTLYWSGAVGRFKHGVSLLGDGAEWFKAKVEIEVSRASEKAIEAVERQGGTIVTAHYNRLGLKVLLKPWRFLDGLVPRRALPNKKLMPYYLDPKKRCPLVSTDILLETQSSSWWVLVEMVNGWGGYLAVTEAGKERLKEGGIEGAYLGPDGFVHIPGKKVTLYSEVSPTKEEMEQRSLDKEMEDQDDGTPV